MSENVFASFSRTRMRRNRQSAWVRDMVREHHLQASDLIWPVFVHEGQGEIPVQAMPGVYRFGLDVLAERVKVARDLGIPAVALFPSVPAEKKDEAGTEAFNADNLMCRAIALLKEQVPGIGVIADVALDPYTSHGQDGVVRSGKILNDETVLQLCKQAGVLAEAGADVVAPSDMMDGRIGAIRDALDANGFQDVLILSYAAKYASALYGPFREAVGSAQALGSADKRTYQMDAGNSDEALREAELDVAEGADMLMVKPGIVYLDIVQRLADAFTTPVFAYHVSGEYAMIKAAAEKGWVDEKAVVLEKLLACKRAGARGVLTYHAVDVAGWLAE